MSQLEYRNAVADLDDCYVYFLADAKRYVSRPDAKADYVNQKMEILTRFYNALTVVQLENYQLKWLDVVCQVQRYREEVEVDGVSVIVKFKVEHRPGRMAALTVNLYETAPDNR